LEGKNIYFKLELEEVNKLLKKLKPCLIDNDNKVYTIGNQRFNNAFSSNQLSIKEFQEKAYQNLEFGIIIIEGMTSIKIYNDVFGAYPLFLSEINEVPTLSNTFNFHDNHQLDEVSIIQYIHFNHILGDRTLSKGIKRLKGGTCLSINTDGFNCEQLVDWSILESILFDEKLENSSLKSWEFIQDFIKESNNGGNENILTLTGGFDSRLLLGSMLSSDDDFETITWGQSGNLQTETAKKISDKFKLNHIEIKLDRKFQNNVDEYLEEIIKYGSETPFIIDIPQFIHMCRKLKRGTNLVSGFMGSEIIRGPSYSSQVTLTKFAADIGLAHSKEEIRQVIEEFQEDYPFIRENTLKKNMDELIKSYSRYSKIGLNQQNKNTSIFKYLFLEKYPKIYGPIIKLHQDYEINLINPFMSIDYIRYMLIENQAKSKLKPYEGKAYYNYKLYKYYAHALHYIYPKLNETYVDRGYIIKDLISPIGVIKLPFFQIYRKLIKKNRTKNAPTVDSKKWYKSQLQMMPKNLNPKLNSIINNQIFQNFNNFNGVDSVKAQLILGLNKKIKT
jgi:hypothetical protein